MHFHRVILFCARGMPDLTSRAVLFALVQKIDVPVLGLFDYNPGGILILLTYREGSNNTTLLGKTHAVDVKWLGLRNVHINGLNIPQTQYQPLKPIDHRMIGTISNHAQVCIVLKCLFQSKKHPEILYELEHMLSNQCKLELESLNALGYEALDRFILTEITSRSWVL